MVHELAGRHGFVSLDLPIWAMDMRLMDNFFLSHPEGPHPDGEGWKDLDWQRRLLRLFGLQFDPDGDLQSVRAAALDLRKNIAYLRDTAVSPYSLSSDENEVDGPLRLDLGVTRTFTRATVATIEDVDDVVVQVTSGTERVGPEGILIEDYRKNFCKESSFKVWTGGASAAPDEWTEVDADTSLTIAQVTNGIFDSDLSTYGCRLTSTSSGNYGLDQSATFAWEQDDNGVLSVDHEDHSGDGLLVGLYRNGDTQWWNPSTGAWQAGAASLRFSVAPAGSVARDYMPFDNGITTNYTGTYLIWIRADQSNHDVSLHHVQLEGGNTVSGESGFWYPTSRIITQSASAIPRNADISTLSTNPTQGRRIIHPDNGTLFVKLKVDYAHAALDDALLAGGARSVGILHADMFTTNDCYLIYDAQSSRFEFDYRTVTAYAGSSLTAGEYVFALRWCSDKGELDLANWYVDLFVNGTKGTGGAGTARTEGNATKYFYYGQLGVMTDINRINGWISRIVSTPFVLTDAEVKAWTDRI
jgi:hypothetical protein